MRPGSTCSSRSGLARRASQVLARAGRAARTLLLAGGRRRRAIGYVGRVGHSNLGDQAMFRAFRCALPTACLLPSMGVRPIEHRVWGLACRRTMCACILGGGTLVFGDNYYEYLTRALDAGVPCFVLGTGVRSPEYWQRFRPEQFHSPALWKQALDECRFVGVRGPLSQNILADVGFARATVVGDPAFMLAPDAPPQPATQRILGVNWGTSLGYVWGGDESGPLERLTEALSMLVGDGWRLRLYCVWPEDRRAIAELKAGLPPGTRIEVEEHFEDPVAYVRSVSKCRVFVGVKLHSVALALNAGVPAIMLEYRPKCGDLMASLGLGHHVTRIDRIDPETLRLELERLAERSAGFAGAIRPALEGLKKRLLAAIMEHLPPGGTF